MVMRSNWWRRVWYKGWRAVRPVRENRRPDRLVIRLQLESLEGRITPVHNITIVPGGTATLADVAAFANMPAVDVTIDPSTIEAAGADVVLQANNDIIFSAPVDLTVAAVAFTAQAGRSIVMAPGTGLTTANQTITLTANETTANGVIAANRDAGTALLTMDPTVTLASGGGDIRLTLSTAAGHTPTSGDITLGGLDSTLPGGTISVSNNGPNLGGIALQAAVDAGTGTVELTAGGTVTQTAAGAITAANLGVLAGDTIDLCSTGAANQVDTFAADTTGGGTSPILFTDTTAFTVGTVPVDLPFFAGFRGVTASGGNIVLVTQAGDLTIDTPINAGTASVELSAAGMITESGTGSINTNQLTTSSTAGTTLGSTNNMVASFQANNPTSGNVILTDVVPLLTIIGITAGGNGSVQINNTGGSISVTGTINATAVTIMANGSISESGAGVIDANQLTTNSATGTTLGGTNLVESFQATNSTSMDITFNDTAPTPPSLTIISITQSGPGNVFVTNTGDILITGLISAGATVGLTSTNGAITESGAGAVHANQLTTISAAGTTLGGTNNVVANFQAANNTTGDITFLDAVATLTITAPAPGIIQSGPGNVTVTNTGGNLTVSAKITMSGGTLQLNSHGTVTINAPIDPASVVIITAFGDAVINFPVTATDRIAVFAGLASPAFTGNVIVNASLTQTTAGRTGIELYTGTSAGSITLSATVSAQDTVWLTAANNATEMSGGTISAANLLLLGTGTGTFTLNGANAISAGGMLAGQLTGDLTFINNFAITVGTLPKPQGGPNVLGLTTTTGNITLTLNNGLALLTLGTASNGERITAQAATAIVDLNVGGITENTNAIISAANLRLQGTGTFNLNQNNLVNTVAGNFIGSLAFNNANATLIVDMVLGTLGLISHNNNITLCNTGDILLNQPVNAGMNAGTVTVRLKSGGAVMQGTGPGAMGVITADQLGVDAVGSILLDTLANTVSVFAAQGSTVSVSFAGPFSLGPISHADCFTNDISGIMSPSGSVQNITICQQMGTLIVNMALTATDTVRLVASNGGVTQMAGASITAAKLGVRATSNVGVVTGGDIALDMANNNVGTFAALNMDTNRWAIRFLNVNPAGTLVGTIAAASCFTMTAGVVNTNGDVTLSSSNGTTPLTIGSGQGEGITATGGTVDLSAGGVTETALPISSKITATNLRLRSAGPGPFTFNLGQNNAITSTLAGNFFGSLVFTNNAGITVAPITLNAITTPDLNSNGSNITLTLNGGLTINTPSGGIRAGSGTVDLFVAGATEANATSTITAAGLRLRGTGTFNLNQSNAIGILVGNFTGPLFFSNTTALTVSTLLSTSGLTSNGNNIMLTLNGGTSPLTINTPAGPVPGIVAQGATVDINAGGGTENNATSTIIAANLRLQGTTGNFNLGQGNTVGIIAGNFTGSLIFFDSMPLTVGMVLGTVGLTSTTGNITLNVVNGTGPLSIGTGMNEGIAATQGTVELLSGGASEATGSTIAAAKLLIRGPSTGGPFPFSLAQNNIVGTIAGSTSGDIVFADGSPLTVGAVVSPSGAGTIAGLVSVLHNITLLVGGGTLPLTIGDGVVASESISGIVVDLDAGGINEAAGFVTATNLRLRSASGGPFPFTLTNAMNAAATLAGDFFGPLTYNSNAVAVLTVDTVLGTAGLTSHGSNITLTLNSPLTVNQTINAGTTGNINLTASGTVTFNNDAPIAANTAAVRGIAATNTLIVNYSGAVDTTWTVTAANAGTIANNRFTITASPQAISFTSFQNLTGGAGADDFIFNDGATLSGLIDGSRSTIAGKADTIDWSRYTTARTVSVLGPAAHGVVGSEPSLGAGFTNIDALVGTVSVFSTLIGPNGNSTWAITGRDAGPLTTNYGGGVISQVFFANFANLKGGSLIDAFVFQNAGQVAGSIDGGGAPFPFVDTLDWSQVTTDRAVHLTGFGTLTGYAGNETGSVASFTNIGQLIGTTTTARNTLFGENQNRTWTLGTTTDGTNVHGAYTDPTSQRSLNFLNFQVLFGGTGQDTFNVYALTPNRTLEMHGGGSSPAGQDTQTVQCSPSDAEKVVTNSITLGDTVNFIDQGTNAAYSLGRSFFIRSAGVSSVATFFNLQRVYLQTGQGGSQAVGIGDTAILNEALQPQPASTQVDLRGTASNTAYLGGTGAKSNLTVNALAGTSTININNTGPASVTSVNSVQPTANDVINLNGFDPTSGVAITTQSPSAVVNVNVFMGAASYPGLVTVTHPTANGNPQGAIFFNNFNTGAYIFLPGTPGTPDMVRSRTDNALLLCVQGLTIPQRTFVVSAFLLPTVNQFGQPIPGNIDAAGRPRARVVLVSSLFGSLNLQNFSLPPVVANPNFANPFGYGPPSVAVADVNGDGTPDLIVAAGPGFAPLVTVYDGRSIFQSANPSQSQRIIAQFFAYDSRFVGGVNVAAGNIAPPNPALFPVGKDAIITGTGRGGLPIVEAFVLDNSNSTAATSYNGNVFPGGGATIIRYFLAYQNTYGGVRVASGNFNGGNHDDIVTAPGPGDAPNVRVFSGTNPSQLLRNFFAYDPAFRGGVDVAVGKFHAGGDNFDDLVTAPASAGNSQVNVFSGPTGALQSVFFAFSPLGEFNGVGGIAVDTSTGAPRIIVGSPLGQPAQIEAFDGRGDPLALANSFFDEFGNAMNSPSANSSFEQVAVGGRSR